MSTLGLVAVVLAALVVAAVLVVAAALVVPAVRRRRRAASAPVRPMTVAELVQLRQDAAATRPGRPRREPTGSAQPGSAPLDPAPLDPAPLDPASADPAPVDPERPDPIRLEAVRPLPAQRTASPVPDGSAAPGDEPGVAAGASARPDGSSAAVPDVPPDPAPESDAPRDGADADRPDDEPDSTAPPTGAPGDTPWVRARLLSGEGAPDTGTTPATPAPSGASVRRGADRVEGAPSPPTPASAPGRPESGPPAVPQPRRGPEQTWRAPPSRPTAVIPAARRPSGSSPIRRSTVLRTTEQVVAGIALRRTFGPAGVEVGGSAVVSLAATTGCRTQRAVDDGPAQPIVFRAVRRDGSAVARAAVTLLDDRGRETGAGTTDGNGCGELWAPRPGGYVLVCTAPDHQPGAVALSVTDRPAHADVLLARSAWLSGSVHGEAGPIVGARLTLVQDGEVVDAVDSGSGGAFRIPDLAAGEYGLRVVADDCEPTAVLLDVADGGEVRRDVDLDPSGCPAPDRGPTDDLVIGHR